MMSNVYWAGALPGLLMATAASIWLVRLLDRSQARHILWLVPALHFSGAFLVGPALAVAYDQLVIPWADFTAPYAWVAALAEAALLVYVLARRTAMPAARQRASAAITVLALAAVLVPVSYHIIAG